MNLAYQLKHLCLTSMNIEITDPIMSVGLENPFLKKVFGIFQFNNEDYNSINDKVTDLKHNDKRSA